MKNLFLSTILLAIPLLIFSQFSWEELEPNNSQPIQVIYVTESEEIMGILNHPPQLLSSNDRGESWQVIGFGDNLIDLISEFGAVFKEHQGEFYISSDEAILKLNRTTGSAENWLALDNIWRLDDFAFLPNGNLVVSDGNDILLFDNQKQLIRSKEWSSHSVKFLIGDGDEHYAVHSIGATDYIGKFNSAITELTDYRDYLAPRNQEIIYENGKLFSSESYSEDGELWIPYPDELSGITTYLSSGNLHLIDRDVVYLSLDEGVTFIYQGTLPDNYFFYSDFTHPLEDNGLLIYDTNSYCGGNNVYVIADGLLDVQSVNNRKGLVSNLFIEAGDYYNVYAGECTNPLQYLSGDQQSWEDINSTFNNSDCFYSSSFVSTSSGAIISSQGCRSINQGQTWTNNVNDFISLADIVTVKDEVVYIVEYNNTFWTEDYGLSWNNIQHVEDANIFDAPLGISSTGFMYTANFQFQDSLFKRTLDGDIVSHIESPVPSTDPFFPAVNLVGFATAYAGPSVFSLYEDWNGDALYFYYSYDDGISFESKLLNEFKGDEFTTLETDHLGNVYIYNESRIWLSQDEGQSWQEITPEIGDYFRINNIDISWDNHIYIATSGTPILKSKEPLAEPTTLEILVFEDDNNNCVYDNGETGLENIKVSIGSFVTKLTNTSGETISLLQPGNYQINADLRSDLYESCNNNFEVNLEGQINHFEIPVNIIDECADLSIGATTPFLRRCFDNTYHLEVYNAGTETATDVRLNLELDEYFDFLSSDMEVLSNNGQVYLFGLGDINARESKRFKLNFNLSCDAELGAAHYLNAELLYDNPCNTQTRVNIAFECQENIGSYDPNDKAIFVSGIANKEIIAEADQIEYLIRFQNTGTDTAFTVRIEDQLSSAFDKSSIYPVVASHDFSWSIEYNNLIVNFDDILLVDSTRNEEASHGFIKFNIDLKPDQLAPGSLLKNTAEIYFDFNEPIVTNTVESYYLCKHSNNFTEVSICEGETFMWDATGEVFSEEGFHSTVLPSIHGCDSTIYLTVKLLEDTDPDCNSLSIEETEKGILKLYPNPVQNILRIEYNGVHVPNSYSVLNVNSELVRSDQLDSEMIINVADLDSGVYIVCLYFENHQVLTKEIVVMK